ncbi:MAG: carboxymuconolactone decarboxylase family protein [Haliscomenobacteraceae bacterium CHB4]|nr:carboxymuconolactone decarboxylase family protein [Haliscomenobacteraceae bacterium CHB4]
MRESKYFCFSIRGFKSTNPHFPNSPENMKYLLPIREELTSEALDIMAACEAKVGFVPSIVQMLAYSPPALRSYLTLYENQALGVFNDQEREAIYLPVSQMNGSQYCLAAHTNWAKLAGLSEEETLALRKGVHHEDPKLDFLARFGRAVAETRGQVPPELMDEFGERGYDARALLDVIAIIVESVFSNLIGVMMRPPVDFPAVKEV